MRANKILLTGINGQVGHALLPKLSEFQVIGLSRAELDLTNTDAIREVIREIKPDLVINPAAYTAVDKAESEPDLANAINAVAPRVIAEEVARLGSALIHFSTDYVYDGNKKEPYVETDEVNPISVYGKSKLVGEQAIQAVGLPHLVLRTSWVYGPHGKNFLKSILRLAGERDCLNIVGDQMGSPTSSLSIADAVSSLIPLWHSEKEAESGIYHLSNNGNTTWHGFTCEIINQYNRLNLLPALKVNVNNIAAITTAEYPTPAARPVNSVLGNTKLKRVFDVALPPWQDGLQRVMQSKEFLN